MAHIETERKFLVKDSSYRLAATESIRMIQGYICREPGRTVRVRIAGDKAWLTIKGPGSDSGMSRYEWEKEIPADEAAGLMGLCPAELAPIDKTRYMVPYGGHVFEVDEFHGKNEGLIMAEVELASESEDFSRPDWLGMEVTGDRRYYNSMLIASPYSSWPEEDRRQSD